MSLQRYDESFSSLNANNHRKLGLQYIQTKHFGDYRCLRASRPVPSFIELTCCSFNSNDEVVGVIADLFCEMDGMPLEVLREVGNFCYPLEVWQSEAIFRSRFASLNNVDFDNLTQTVALRCTQIGVDPSTLFDIGQRLLYSPDSVEQGERQLACSIVVKAALKYIGMRTQEFVQRPRRHSADFHSVLWDGVTYEFTHTQAHCVKLLWNAWENRTPALSWSPPDFSTSVCERIGY